MLAVGAASAAAAPAAAPVIHRSVRTVTGGAAIPFPTGQTVTPIQGIQNPEIPPEPDQEGDDAAAATTLSAQRHRTVQHSLSHRPSAKMTAQLRAAEAAAELTVPSVTPKPVAGSNPGAGPVVRGPELLRPALRQQRQPVHHRAARPGPVRRQRVRAGDHQRRAAGLQPRRRPLSPVTDLNTFYGYPRPRDRSVHRHQPPRHRRLPDLQPAGRVEHLPAAGPGRRHPGHPPATPTAPASGTTRTWAPTSTAST
jgi:hypothetical protein